MVTFAPRDRFGVFVRFLIPLIILLALPAQAFGHAEPPLAQSVFGFGDTWVLKANFGVVSNGYEGFVCEEAFLGGDRYIAALVGPDQYVTFGETAIHVTTDGCDFTLVKQLSQAPADAVADPTSQTIVYLDNADDTRGVWTSDDAGQSFERFESLNTEDLQLTGVRFANPTTIIVSAYERSPDAMGAGRMLEIDLNTGSVTNLIEGLGIRYPYVLDATAGGLIWLGRRDAQAVFVGSYDSPIRDEIGELVSWPSGALISDDGQTVWVSGLDEGSGVRRGVFDGEELVWTQLAQDVTASCLGKWNGDILMCSARLLETDDLYRIDGDALEPVTNFEIIDGPRACPAGTDVATVCPIVWGEFAQFIGKDPGLPDMGNPQTDMGSPQDMSMNDSGGGEPSDDGCSTTRSHAPTSWALGLLFGIVVLRIRRRIRH